MTMFLLSFREKPVGIVKPALLPAASRSVAPPARTRGELLSSGLAVGPAATIYVAVADVALLNGVIVTLAPSFRLRVCLDLASVTDSLKFTVMGMLVPAL